MNDASSFHVAHLLKKKGYNLIMEKHFIMPYNIMFRYPDLMAKQMYLYLDPLTEVLAKKLFLKETEKNTLQVRPYLSFLFSQNRVDCAETQLHLHISQQEEVHKLPQMHERVSKSKHVHQQKRQHLNQFFLFHVHEMHLLLPKGCHQVWFHEQLES